MDKDTTGSDATLSSIQELIKVVIQKQDNYEMRQQRFEETMNKYEERQNKYEERQERFEQTMNSLKELTSETRDKMELLESNTNSTLEIISNDAKTQVEYIFLLDKSIKNISEALRTNSAKVHKID